MGSGHGKKVKQTAQTSGGKRKGSFFNSTGSDMPLFKRQSPESKKRLQHQLYLARENPQLTFDISSCEISEVPSGVFALCKVLQKEALLAHTNWLTALKGGGNLADLSGLRILDLHDNELSHLPDDLSCLTSLQVLNCENNKLKALPESIGSLQALQTLNLKGNKIKLLPDSVGDLPGLRTLDLSQNNVVTLPRRLCLVHTLDTLILDADTMVYPDADICVRGTESVMKFLCSESDVDYIPPSTVLLDVLDSPKSPTDPISDRKLSFQAQMDSITNSVLAYENLRARKLEERLALEKQLAEDQERHAELALLTGRNKEQMMHYIAQDRDRIAGEFEAAQIQRDEQHKRLLDTLRQAEENAAMLVSQLLEMNEKAQKTEELLEALERERMEAEQWFVVRQEESNNLRKAEVLVAMEQILEENTAMDQLMDQISEQRNQVIHKANEERSGMENHVEALLSLKQRDQQLLLQKLLSEEQLQMEAFEALQLQKDTRHQRITGQIQLIEQELAQLTVLEVEQKQQKVILHNDILEEKRHALTHLLIQLMEQRDERASELKKRMVEMEGQREQDQTDYWLVQYQRLMDRKPQSLIDQESHLELSVIKILEAAEAGEYIPRFARHRISIETLLQITDDDLKQMGVHELGLRRAILTETARYQQRQDDKLTSCQRKIQDTSEPSAPQAEEEVTEPSAPQEVIARGINSECVVCLDNVSAVLFLNCGHVCCCVECARPISLCPLCRSDIVQQIKLLAEPINV